MFATPTARTARDTRARKLFARVNAHDQAARAELVELFLPLSRRLALRYAHSGEPLEDLVQVANLGLVKAIDRFDSTRAVSFASFAIPTILGELKRYFRDTTWAVHVPRDLQEHAALVERSAQRLFAESGRSPSVVRLAEVTGLTEEQVLEAHCVSSSYKAKSFEERPGADGDEDLTIGERIGAEDRELDRTEQAISLQQICHVLSHRDREVLRLRFEHDMMQSEIAAEIGVSQMQVSRILRAALERLNQHAHEIAS